MQQHGKYCFPSSASAYLSSLLFPPRCFRPFGPFYAAIQGAAGKWDFLVFFLGNQASWWHFDSRLIWRLSSPLRSVARPVFVPRLPVGRSHRPPPPPPPRRPPQARAEHKAAAAVSRATYFAHIFTSDWRDWLRRRFTSPCPRPGRESERERNGSYSACAYATCNRPTCSNTCLTLDTRYPQYREAVHCSLPDAL